MENKFWSLSFTDDGFAVLKLTNGENRLNLTSVRAINQALDEVLRNKDCKALITTGEGKFYSNGIDLDWMMSGDRNMVAEFNKELLNMLWRLMHFPIPTVAAINGHAFAGGAFLAMCHDYRVMRSDRGWISWNETHLKIPFGAPLLEVLNTRVRDLGALREAVVFGKRITGKQAHELSLVDVVTELSNLIPTAKKLALDALGPTGIDRNILETMKKDFFPRKLDISKL